MDVDIVPVDVYAFGGRSAPRSPRIEGYNLKPGQMTDVTPNENGFIGPAEPPEGASTFGDPAQAPLAGHYHRLRAGTMLSEGLGIKADGIDIAGGTRQPTHHTIYPTRAMLPAEFDQLFQSLPWEYGGRL